MVNIYITTTAKGPRIWKTAYYVYTMEYNGHTRNHSGRMKNCTENQLELNIIAAPTYWATALSLPPLLTFFFVLK